MLALATSLMALVLALGRLHSQRRYVARKKESSAWAAWRNRTLCLSAEDIQGVDTSGNRSGDRQAYGVVVEWATPANALTLAALADGTAVLQSSAGGDALKADGAVEAALVAKQLVAEATGWLGELKAAALMPKPLWGNVRFYVLTRAGVFTAEEAEEALEHRWSRLTPLYDLGAGLRDELRRVEREP